MRLAMFSTFYPPFHFGGDAIFLHRLSHALGDQGHDVDVFHNEDAYRTLASSQPAPGYAEHPRVQRIGLRSALGIAELLAVQQSGRPISHASRLHEVFRPGRYDVVHFHNVSLMGAPALLRQAADTDAVSLLTLHDHWLVCPMHVLWRYDREACEERTCVRCQLKGRRPPQLWRYSSLRDRGVAAVDAVLAPSEFTRAKHRELGLKADARLLPHFVLPPVAAGERVRPSQKPYFLFAGRLERLKGAHTLIEAFRHFRGAELLIAGDGTERASLQALASGLGHVHFLGRLPAAELGRYYAEARAALVPSLCYEVFGLSAVEAMAAGTPVVVRNLGALPELVRESDAGFVYREEQELIPILQRLTEDDALRTELSMRAVAAYRARWTLERHLERYHEIIANIRTNKRSRQDAASPVHS